SGDMFDAVLATAPASPWDFARRVAALRDFLQRPEASSLTLAHKRIANILKKSPTNDVPAHAPLRPELLREPAERSLHAALLQQLPPVTRAVAEHDYARAFERLAALRAPIDAFFDTVMVNDPDAELRANRHALLRELRALFAGVADLSFLPG
ncbi:MAG: DALR anticodon-binding domain-containing protein, partial [Steroidobacteraceae bacterium]|nr:DALR anticodon-binding domain-containing protein [Steroidobacteraceae bacterium]MDW8258285.1 DALR anticodon-binding domain-containing protein [Gammaproteobacteria bacterium]